MDHDQISTLRNVFSAAFAYLTCPEDDAPDRRIELCESLGSLIMALEPALFQPEPENDVRPTDIAGPVDHQHALSNVIPFPQRRKRGSKSPQRT